jgi:hypothetical protein
LTSFSGVSPAQAYPFDPNSAHDQYAFARQIWRTGEGEACHNLTVQYVIEGMEKQLAWFNSLIGQISSVLGDHPDARTSDGRVNARLDHLQEELPQLQDERAVIVKWLALLRAKPKCFEFPTSTAYSGGPTPTPDAPHHRGGGGR